MTDKIIQMQIRNPEGTAFDQLYPQAGLIDEGLDPDWTGVKFILVAVDGKPFLKVVAV